MTAIVLYPLLTASLYYLLVRAEITRPLWRHYPARVDRFMACAACSGFWYGLAVAAVLGRHLHLPFGQLDAMSPLTPIVVAFCSVIWTPVIAWLHLVTLDQLTMPPLEASENANQT